MKYFIEWLKDLSLVFDIEPRCYRFTLLFVHFWIKFDKRIEFNLGIRFPKYSFVIHNSQEYYYKKDSSYCFYEKIIIKNIKFSIMHVIGKYLSMIDSKLI